jgi:dihydroorotate dehydrogenase (fumarate)
MDLSTRYLGFDLPHPFMPGASPMVDDLDTVKRLEDAGASAIVMHSLFEEQLVGEQLAAHAYMHDPAESFAEALSYQPDPDTFTLGPEQYLEQLRRIKETVSVPVIGSLNGISEGGWLEYAKLLEEAGADAIELNTYQLSTDPTEKAEDIEARVVRMLHKVKGEVHVPVAVKLSPYYTGLAHFAQRLAGTGVDGLVLFNRLYQSDIDVEELEVTPTLALSGPSELLLRIRWLAVLSGRVGCSLACSGGVHTEMGALKAVMAGAHAVQLVSALLKGGPEVLTRIKDGVSRWLEEHEYESLAQAQGSMGLQRCPDPKAYERTQYLQVLQSWKGFS